MKIEGSRILVTGASSGIGAALARQLAERGATVGIVARRRARLEEVLTDCQRQAPASRLWAADLGDLARAEQVVYEAWQAFGHLDALINNAAIPNRTHLTKLTHASLEETMRVNFYSPVAMAMAALPKMRERKAGVIMNVSSLGGRLGIVHEAAYCAAKAALCGWSESAFIDLHGEPVKVKLILPGPIDTEIWDVPTVEAPLFHGPKVPAADCAKGIVAALEEEDGFEYYVPDLKGVAVAKTQDSYAFLRGSAQAMRGAHGS
jgi:short-subunit dehydrogenase